MAKYLLRFSLVFIVSIVMIKPTFAQRVEKERKQFKQYLIKNPNYFGTLKEFYMQPVKTINYNTGYEELQCIGFYPEQNILEAVIDIKKTGGYGGKLCLPGTYEYVRFFADWNGDGDYLDPDEDLGISTVNVHDIPNKSEKCLSKYKPLTFALPLSIEPPSYVICKTPYIVKVKGILSWEIEPTVGDPSFIPVWGNVIERWIQIKPLIFPIIPIFPYEPFEIYKPKLEVYKPEFEILKPELEKYIDKELLMTKETLDYTALKEIYIDKDVPEKRFNFVKLNQQAKLIQKNPMLMVEYLKDPGMVNFAENIKDIINTKKNTSYEEMTCLGLNYAQDQLVSTITVKKEYGYSGDLCTDGSYEYVAFWIYVYNDELKLCEWKYVGTVSVNVHDIPSLPTGGLKYAVYLPVDFSSYKKLCATPVVIKTRAVLSWNAAPSTTDPYETPTWGNALESIIQLRPGEPISGDEQKPFIWSLGNTAVESISGNAYTTLGSSLGDGYANGVSVGGGYTALESPFGKMIQISGYISNAPNISEGATSLKYKVQYRQTGEAVWHDISNSFYIWKRIDGVPSGTIYQSVDVNGYYTYQRDISTPTLIDIQNDVIAQFYTPVAQGDGLYEIRVLLSASPSDVPSELIKCVIDNTGPTTALTMDAGACSSITLGDTVTGKFTATDKHIWKYSLTMTPSVASPPSVSPTGSTYPILSAPGLTNQGYTITTSASTTPCGYVLRLSVWDRTIKNNSMTGNYSYKDVGMCILEP